MSQNLFDVASLLVIACILSYKGIFDSYASPAKIIYVACNHRQVVNQCNRGNLFIWVFVKSCGWNLT